MPGVTRANVDRHIGHARPTIYGPGPDGPVVISPGAPVHQTNYKAGQTTVYANNNPVIRLTDTTECGDPASEGSPNVFAENKAVHRIGDGTQGHTYHVRPNRWVPNRSESGSGDVFANGE